MRWRFSKATRKVRRSRRDITGRRLTSTQMATALRANERSEAIDLQPTTRGRIRPRIALIGGNGSRTRLPNSGIPPVRSDFAEAHYNLGLALAQIGQLMKVPA